MNYQIELDKIIEGLDGKRPSVLLHSCCGPCSSYVISYLNEYFDITVLYYNPSIYPTEEYEKRKAVQLDLINRLRSEGMDIKFIDCDYDHNEFLKVAAGHEWDPECGERCHNCYYQRLEETAKRAALGNFDYFCTTLTVSPYKSAPVLNMIGEEISRNYEVSWLPSDFKKKGGYKQSIEMSKAFGLYRQEYCGCEFSTRGYVGE
ncbi:MAG: epoxyqueuosine reductase QueH [Oscillospiraceae bacterium]|nr:epoxyqueuosine reductase QueH [Candidatus Limimonas coprohippi]